MPPRARLVSARLVIGASKWHALSVHEGPLIDPLTREYQGSHVSERPLCGRRFRRATVILGGKDIDTAPDFPGPLVTARSACSDCLRLARRERGHG